LDKQNPFKEGAIAQEALSETTKGDGRQRCDESRLPVAQVHSGASLAALKNSRLTRGEAQGI
jgi:hypothetical protein